MDLATLKTDVTTWVAANKMTAVAIGLAAAAGIYFLATSKPTPTRRTPSASLAGHPKARTHHSTRRKRHHHLKLVGLS